MTNGLAIHPNASNDTFFQPGCKIANGKGVTGTVACIAYRLEDGIPVMLTSYHSLSGGNAGWGEPVWLLSSDNSTPLYSIGYSCKGVAGLIQHNHVDYYVDAAIATLSPAMVWFTGLFDDPAFRFRGIAEPVKGEEVKRIREDRIPIKGIVADMYYSTATNMDGVIHDAGNQLLIRPVKQRAFCSPGDSGALIVNSRQEIVGLLWGSTELGEGIACPIIPVFKVLQLTLQPITQHNNSF